MRDQTDFKPSLIKPLLVVIGIEALLTFATVKVILWSAGHGRPHWAANVPLWDGLANIVLLVGWIAYVQFRKRKAPRQQ
jgi:hypothetical protein